MEDDVYPNEGTFMGGVPREPSEQIRARKKERAEVIEAQNVIRDMVKRLDERIAFYENNSSIPDEVRTDPQAFLIVHNSYTAVAIALKSERDWIKDILDTNIKS